MKLRIAATVISFSATLQVYSQKTIKHYNILWYAYTNNIQVSKKWWINSDAQLRTNNWSRSWYLYAVRSELSYAFNDRLTAGAGFALFKNAVYDKDELLFFKNEFRPWEDIMYVIKNKAGFVFSQRLRGEERYLQQTANNKRTSNYQYLFRLRYRFDFLFPITNKLGIMAGNEIMVNPGHLSNSLFFDQNRFFAGPSINVGLRSTLHAQYIKIFQWHASTSVLDNQNVIRLNFIQKFNLTKQKNASKATK